jgi:hypothetical protein
MSLEADSIDRPRPAAEKSAVDARQGVISGRVLTLLVTSTVLAILAIAISFWAAH